MHRSKSKGTTEESAQAVDHDSDRYPDTEKALRRILEESDIPKGPVDRLEVNVHADGSITYRSRAPRAEDWDGGYLAPG